MSWKDILKMENLVKYSFYAESSKPVFRVIAELLDGVKREDGIEHFTAKNISNSEHIGYVRSEELDSLEILMRIDYIITKEGSTYYSRI